MLAYPYAKDLPNQPGYQALPGLVLTQVLMDVAIGEENAKDEN